MNVVSKEKIIFSAGNADQDDVKHLAFSEGFKIGLSGNKSKIILGANGVGKTSIFREIRNDKNNQYIDYNDIKNDFIKNKKKIIIGAKIKILQEKKNERNILINKIDIKKIKEIFSVSTLPQAKAIDPYLEKILKDPVAVIEQFNEDKFKEIGVLLPDQVNFLLKNAKQIIEINEAEIEINRIKSSFLIVALNNLESYLSDDEKKCPVCDTEKNETIIKIITTKKSSLVQLDNALIKKASGSYQEKNADEIKIFLSKIKENIVKNDITILNIINLGISTACGEPVKGIINELKKLDSEIQELEKENEKFFNFLKKQEINIKDEFNRIFKVSEDSVVFNNEAKEIEINLEREIEKYSTGEINLMVFVVYIYEALASDKELIVIDDPLSSYDIINQYLIIYKIAFAHKNDKKLLIFTHNIDTINISNSQHGGLFEYQYIEEYQEVLHIHDIEPIKGDSFLKIDNLLTTEDQKEEYIKLIIEKENVSVDSEMHKVFHYDEPYTYKEIFTNEYLVTLIDAFNNNFENKSFRENCIDKIMYLTAIRVWIEKQFLINTKEAEALHGKTFGEKVDYLFSEGKLQKWTGPSKVTRSFLMSKKVMLNQNTHTESQSVPFEYALNLSLDNLAKEILDIKEAFTNSDK